LRDRSEKREALNPNRNRGFKPQNRRVEKTLKGAKQREKERDREREKRGKEKKIERERNTTQHTTGLAAAKGLGFWGERVLLFQKQ